MNTFNNNHKLDGVLGNEGTPGPSKIPHDNYSIPGSEIVPDFDPNDEYALVDNEKLQEDLLSLKEFLFQMDLTPLVAAHLYVPLTTSHYDRSDLKSFIEAYQKKNHEGLPANIEDILRDLIKNDRLRARFTNSLVTKYENIGTRLV